MAVPYYTDVGSRGDWILGSETPAVIAVLEALGQSTPVGIAFRVGGDHAGRALWTLRVYDEDLPGQWVVVDREFQPAECR